MKRVTTGVSALLLLAACGTDGGSARTITAQQFGDRYVAGLRKCELISEEGDFNAVPPGFFTVDGRYSACQAACLKDLTSSCAELAVVACGGGTTDRVADCVSDCNDSRLTCANGKERYTTRQRCDGAQECSDGSDERGCFIYTGRCDDGSVITAGFEAACDGREHCNDGSDEYGCPEPRYCENGDAIPAHELCDGEDYCDGGEDEGGCEATPAGFSCDSGFTLLPRQSVCNGVRECNDGADERQGCATLTCGENLCDDAVRCDGYTDCDDGADERNCDVSCDTDDYCDGVDNGCGDEVGCEDECFASDYCDGEVDCAGGIDELDCPDECDSVRICDGIDEGCGDEISCTPNCDFVGVCNGIDEGCNDEDDCEDECATAVECNGIDEGCGDEDDCEDPCDTAGICDGFDEGCGDEDFCEDPCDSAGLCDGFDEGCGDEVGCEP